MKNNFPSELGMAMGAQLEAQGNVPVGKLVRKNTYRVENYPPLDIPMVQLILGDRLFAKYEKEITEIMVPREGTYKVPVGFLVGIVQDDLTKTMLAALYSQPMWVDESPNLVVNEGLDDALDKHLKGSSYTAAWYVGLVSGTPSFAAADTMASHAGWYEVAPFSGARPTLTLGTVSGQSVDNSASKASYSITDSMVVGGAFVVTLPTAEQTSGTIYGGAAFTGGNRTVANGDTLNVTVTATAAAA